jgi:hypothetical protein
MQPAFSQATLDALRAPPLKQPVPLVPLVNGKATCASTIGSVQGVVIDLQIGRQYGGADQRTAPSARQAHVGLVGYPNQRWSLSTGLDPLTVAM